MRNSPLNKFYIHINEKGGPVDTNNGILTFRLRTPHHNTIHGDLVIGHFTNANGPSGTGLSGHIISIIRESIYMVQRRRRCKSRQLDGNDMNIVCLLNRSTIADH